MTSNPISINITSSNDKALGYRYTETQDWFSFNVETWRLLFSRITISSPRVLEIGSWEGRSAVFLLTELCAQGGSIVCIDHFDLMHTTAGRERYAKVTHNLTRTGKPYRVLPQFSVPALMTLLTEATAAKDPGFDWVYVDGSHEADDTFLDGELVWRLARKGAVIIFDDYRWDKEPEESMHHPKRGIDAFLTLHRGEYEILSSDTQYQVVIQKSVEMRIGFLVDEKASGGLDDALGYGIHLALVVDSAYAVGAAVALRSAVLHTSGRITIYVIDIGLTPKDREDIQASVPQRPDVTMKFLKLLQGSLATQVHIAFAKIDMISVLPVERVLYLDADVLVRKDLRELWDVDLKDKALGAVVDIGFPMGHDGTRAPYFNAGVLLMNLAKIRESEEDLRQLAMTHKDAKFRDQDTLNVQFHEEWLMLDLKWNGQGLGTYADLPSEDRCALDFSPLRDAAIVHFTGPVHPRLEHVLNPYLKPYTAKPWGYAGAPGHPFADEWWKVAEETAWRGWKASSDFREICMKKQEEAKQVGVASFESVVRGGRPYDG